MTSLQSIDDRRNYLLWKLADVEEDLKLPELRPKARKGAQNLHMALLVAIQELELILGMRSSTVLDFGND